MTTREDTMRALRETIRSINPNGFLSAGKHDADSGECCILEALSVHLGLDWTDRPEAVGVPDIRPLNDAPWSSDGLRTEHMVRLAEALAPWATWSEDQRRAYTERVVLWTVRNLIADLPGLPDAVRERCRGAATLAEAEAAAWAARAAARAAAAAWASEASASAAAWTAEAADAASAAAWAEAAADRDATLIRAVDGWIDCVDCEGCANPGTPWRWWRVWYTDGSTGRACWCDGCAAVAARGCADGISYAEPEG